MVSAHIAGVPLEETLVPLVPVAAFALAWLRGRPAAKRRTCQTKHPRTRLSSRSKR